MELSDLKLNFLKLKKTKDTIGSQMKTYTITNLKSEKIRVCLKNVFIPFGYETYDKKLVLNVEINPKKNNNHHNMYSSLTQFENEFIDKNNFYNDEVKKDIEGKGYYKNMRESKGGFIIRSLVFGNPEIFTNAGIIRSLMTSKDIIKSVSNVELELGTLWITENNYGFTWYVKKIEVLSN